jgi:hypothetical protein
MKQFFYQKVENSMDIDVFFFIIHQDKMCFYVSYVIKVSKYDLECKGLLEICIQMYFNVCVCYDAADFDLVMAPTPR